MWHDSWYGEWYGEWYGPEGATGAIVLEGFANSSSVGTIELRATIELAGFANQQSFGIPIVQPFVVHPPQGGLAWPSFHRERASPEHAIFLRSIESTSVVGIPTVRPIPNHRIAAVGILSSTVVGIPVVSRRRWFQNSPSGPTTHVVVEWPRRSAPRRQSLNASRADARDDVDCGRESARGRR